MKKIVFILTIVNCSLINTNSFAQWFPAAIGIADSVYLYDCKFVNQNIAYIVGAYGYIYKTTNGAQSWFTQISSTNYELTSVFFINENTGWAVGGGNIIKTTNGGTNWFIQYTSYNTEFECVHFANENTGMVVGTMGPYSIMKTTDGGNGWFTLQNPVPFSDMRGVFMVDTSFAYAVGERHNWVSPVIKTTNGGINWFFQMTAIYTPLIAVSFINRDTGLIAGVLRTLRYTSNGGNNWLDVQLPVPADISDIEHANNNVVYLGGISDNLVMKSTNGGTIFYVQQTGSRRYLAGLSFMNENTGLAVGDRGAVYKTTNGGEPLGIVALGNNVPSHDMLYQNYPNPFNAVTKIKFDIEDESQVSINVYGLTGRLLQILVNENLNAGSYEIELDMSNYASGLYFYVMVAESFKESRKLLLIK